MLNEITNQTGGIILFLVITFFFWVYAKYEPKMQLKLSELEVIQAVERLQQDFCQCDTLQQLVRMEKFMKIVVDHAKKQTPNWQHFERKLWVSYQNRKWYIVNTEYNKCPQNLIPFLSK